MDADRLPPEVRKLVDRVEVGAAMVGTPEGDRLIATIREFFVANGIEDAYDRIEAGIRLCGGDPRNPVLWSAALLGGGRQMDRDAVRRKMAGRRRVG